MTLSMQDDDSPSRVHFLLEDNAHHLSSLDLLRIVEISEHANAAVHVSHRTYQVLIGVPEVFQADVTEALENIGYRMIRRSAQIEDGSTFLLTRR